jgi:hypothetical protein
MVFVDTGVKPVARMWTARGHPCSRHMVTAETPRKFVGDFAASRKYYGSRPWHEGALAFEVVVPFLEGFKELVRTFSI